LTATGFTDAMSIKSTQTFSISSFVGRVTEACIQTTYA